LTIGTLIYLGTLPLGYLSYRKHEKRDAAGVPVGAAAAAGSPKSVFIQPASSGSAPTERPVDPERPPRLN
jgi:CDP-diacylglycerol--serine O-phosphatidyltransferase